MDAARRVSLRGTPGMAGTAARMILQVMGPEHATLLDSDPGVVDAVTRSLIDKVPTLTADHRRSLVGQVLELLDVGKGERLPLPTEAALIRLLAALGSEKGEAAFWARVDAGHSIE